MSPFRSLAALAAALLLAACGRSAESAPAAESTAVSAVDAGGRTVALARPAERVVSLLPSANDLLLAVGARGALVGRSDNDDTPELAALPSVGGMEPSMEALVALRPDLVVVWHAAGSPRLRDALEAQGLRTYAVGTRDTAETFAALAGLGRLVGRDSAASALSARIRRDLAAVDAIPEPDTPSVLFVVNVTPPMTAGPATFMTQLAAAAGARPAFPELTDDWAQLSHESLVRRQPDWLVVGVDGERTLDARIAQLRAATGWRELRAVREGRVAGIPENLLSRPGPHMAETARLLRAAIHGPEEPE